MEEMAVERRNNPSKARRSAPDKQRRLGMGLSTVPKLAISLSSASIEDLEQDVASITSSHHGRRAYGHREVTRQAFGEPTTSFPTSSSRRAETTSSQQTQLSSPTSRSRVFGTVIPSSNIKSSPASDRIRGKQRAVETDDMITPKPARKTARRRIDASDDSDESDELNIKPRSSISSTSRKRPPSPVSVSSSQASVVARNRPRKRIDIPSTARVTPAQRASDVERKAARRCMLKHTRDDQTPTTIKQPSLGRQHETDESVAPQQFKRSAKSRKADETPIRAVKKKASAGTSAQDFFASVEQETVDELRGQVAAEMATRSTDATTFFGDVEADINRFDAGLSEDHEVELRFREIDAFRTTSPDNKVGEEDHQFLDVSVVDLSVDDQSYLSDFVDPDDLCEYCSKAMPRNMSEHLRKLRRDLYACSEPKPNPQNRRARQAPWQQSIQFCTAHLGESITIPLGQRKGYPATIDFVNLDQRLEESWIADRLNQVLREPGLCESFVKAKQAILVSGKVKWDLAQRNLGLQAIIPGYYGQLGQVVLNTHFRQLIRWGVLPLEDHQGSPIFSPLSINDFISYVLIPETATLLIMEDQGYRHTSGDKVAFDRRHQEAGETRMDSCEYGRWKFPEDSKLARDVLRQLDMAVKQKKVKFRRLARSKREAVAPRPSDGMSVVVVDSDLDDSSTAASKDELITPPSGRTGDTSNLSSLKNRPDSLSQSHGSQPLSQASSSDPWADIPIDEAFCQEIDQFALSFSR